MKLSIYNYKDVYKAKKANVESMQKRGYKLISELFVDNSGFGQPDELALTQEQFEAKLHDLILEHGTLTAKLTNVGQFQVYVGLFKI